MEGSIFSGNQVDANRAEILSHGLGTPAKKSEDYGTRDKTHGGAFHGSGRVSRLKDPPSVSRITRAVVSSALSSWRIPFQPLIVS